MHDLAEYEAFGIPAVLAASEEFASAAHAQATSLGTRPAVVYVRHPIQARTDAEIAALADDAIGRLVNAITAAT